MRDKLQTSEYWAETLAAHQEDLEYFLTSIVGIDAPAKEHLNACHAIVDTNFMFALAKYSSGMPPQEIARDALSAICEAFPNLVKTYPPSSELFITQPGISSTHRSIAMLVLCNATQEQAAAYFNAFDQFDPVKDGYGGYDRIFAAYRTYFGIPLTEQPTKLHWTSAFHNLWDAIDPGEPDFARSRHIKVFLEGWYKEMVKEVAAQTDLLGPNVTPNSYVGYWCIEAAAAVVMMDIDDSLFRDHPHYPKDWADWAKTNKRQIGGTHV